MATLNPFDLLGDDDTGDLTQLIAAQKVKEAAELASVASKKGPSQAPPAKNVAPAKLPSKPLPPSQAVRESRSEAPFGGRGGGRGDGRERGRGRGGRGFDRDSGDIDNSNNTNNGYSGGFRATEDGDASKTSERQGYSGYGGTRGGYRGGRRGGFSNEDAGTDGERPPRRVFERRSGTGRGSEFKREGAGRGNWGTPSDEIVAEIEEPVNEGEKIVDAEKQSGQEVSEDAKKDSAVTESDEKKEEPEDKEMTLEEYEKVLGEKRKALLVLKAEERKVDLDKEFESMKLLSNKKSEDEVFVKLGSDKDKRKEASDKSKKSVSINEFLKPAEGDNYYRPGGRGRGRGRGRGGYGYGGNVSNAEAPAIEDVGQFPTLGSV